MTGGIRVLGILIAVVSTQLSCYTATSAPPSTPAACQSAGPAPDDLVYYPGGPYYRADILGITTRDLKNGVTMTYRASLQACPGDTKYILTIVQLPPPATAEDMRQWMAVPHTV